jgi:23S rRNA (pseudouridine1915-N3)-methyltransferase
MPLWVNSGFSEYRRRLPKDYQLNLLEIPPLKRTKNNNINQIITEEGVKLLDAAPPNSLIISMDEHGKEWTTIELAKKINIWHDQQQDISLLIGGPDGLAPDCLKKSQLTWSLSKLTLPHQLVKLFIAEQIYRAWSVIIKHPYHRD